MFNDLEYDDFGDNDGSYIPSGKKARKIANDPTKHYPNKDESKVLRRIKSETGLSEEEVRENKKYNKVLSNARKSSEKPKMSQLDRYYLTLIKKACKNTKLSREHPDTIKWLQQYLDTHKKSRIGYNNCSNDAEQILKMKLK